jgi:hypothetical protein
MDEEDKFRHAFWGQVRVELTCGGGGNLESLRMIDQRTVGLRAWITFRKHFGYAEGFCPFSLFSNVFKAHTKIIKYE